MRKKNIYGNTKRNNYYFFIKTKPLIKKPKKLIDLVPYETRLEIEEGIKLYKYLRKDCCKCLNLRKGILICEISYIKCINNSSQIYDSITKSNPVFQAILYPRHFKEYCLKKNNYKNCFTYINNIKERQIITQKFT